MKYKVRYRYNNKKREVFYLTNLKLWHVLKDNQTGKRSCYFYDKDMPMLDFGEPNPLEGKEEIPYEEWSAKEISEILSNIFHNNGGQLAFLPKTVIQAMDDCELDEQRKAGVMREILETVASNQLN